MRKRTDPRLKLARIRHPLMTGGWQGDAHNGAFRIRGPQGRELLILASNELGWDHVSVHVADEPTITPSWAEMCWVKDLFFEAEEPVMQLHPPRSRYVNFHEGTLHLWRPQEAALPLPPLYLV